MDAAPPRLSIIIPAYNEAARILPTLETIEAFVKTQPYPIEVLIVDDGSKDGTAGTVRTFIDGKSHFRLLQHERNLGKGAAVRLGMRSAQGAYRLFSDADLSTPIEEVSKFFPHAYDVIIGSRRVRGAQLKKRQPFYREAMGRVFSVLVRLLTLHGFLDTQCGFKFFTANAADNIFFKQTINGFGFDVEILFIAKKCFRYRIKEAPVVWRDSPQTQVRLFRDSLRMFVDLLRIRFNDLRGVYD
ncbi:MAG: glycosyltransferase family 2 protein [Elusimicrobia bacterium]|nr:glycosyltransferase family 2 protein [Candidatus Obscuribacterium magneticum]